MKIIIDTREKEPLHFKHKLISEVLTKTLSVGDYGCEYENGDMCRVIFERKSIADLFGSLSAGYARFKQEIIRSKEQGMKLIIVIEGTLEDVERGCKYSHRKPDALIDQLFTIMVKYGVSFICCANRREMSKYITKYYSAITRNNKEVCNV